jgi:hypothetical protein
MGEDGRAVALDMLVEPDGVSLGHDRCERGLADLKRITPQVVAVQLDEVEGVEEYARVTADERAARAAMMLANFMPPSLAVAQRFLDRGCRQRGASFSRGQRLVRLQGLRELVAR